MLIREREESLYRLNMYVVLSQRIIELVLLFVEYLRPLFRLRVTKYPPGVVLRFNHENAKRRNYDVIDLRRVPSQRQGHVVEDFIRLARQEEIEAPRDLRFTDGSSDLGRFQIRPDRENQNEECN